MCVARANPKNGAGYAEGDSRAQGSGGPLTQTGRQRSSGCRRTPRLRVEKHAVGMVAPTPPPPAPIRICGGPIVRRRPASSVDVQDLVDSVAISLPKTLEFVNCATLRWKIWHTSSFQDVQLLLKDP